MMKFVVVLTFLALSVTGFQHYAKLGMCRGIRQSVAGVTSYNTQSIGSPLAIFEGERGLIGASRMQEQEHGEMVQHSDVVAASTTMVETILDDAQMTSVALGGLVFMVSTLLLLPMQDAVAGGAEYGIFAGRTASMLHPVTMLLLFGTSLYSGYLGLQWRRLRGLSTEITDLQKRAPRLSSGLATFPLSDSMKSVNDKMRGLGETDQSLMQTLQRDLELLRGASELDTKIENLKVTRKQLQGADLKEKHHQTGSILLSAGVTVSLLGTFNTYMRAGKLFPGPHLYVGMACTALWACAAALVPAMQKGNEVDPRYASAHLICTNASPPSQTVAPLPFLLTGCPGGAHRLQYHQLGALWVAGRDRSRHHVQGLGEDFLSVNFCSFGFLAV